MINKVSWKIGGEAGSGIASIGFNFAKALQRSGLFVFATNDYPSLIKGGHNTYSVRGDDERIYCQRETIDVLVALNKNTILNNGHELTSEGAIIYDGDKVKLTPAETPKAKLLHVPLGSIATKAGGAIFGNTVALGACFKLLGMDFAILTDLITKSFGKKGGEVAAKNIEAAKAGYDYLEQNYKEAFFIQIQKLPPKNDLLLMGNDALCAGAIKAGCKFVAEYPMSPSSSILHYMAAHERKYGIVVKHTEDEIAAANMIIGAAFTGVRAMTATSGGGFALMVEALGLAGISETPIVMADIQRCGPSTGLPTYTEQADLDFVLHASQGEFPRVVLTPGDVEECFYETFHAFNLAERTQTPVIIISDKYLAESMVTLDKFNTNNLRIDRGKLVDDKYMENAKGYKRHEYFADGTSPRCVPGQINGIHVCSSYEHDETGWTSEEAHDRINMINKRAKKLALITDEEIAPKLYGDANAPLTLVVWGSTKMPAMEAMKMLEKQGVKIRLMHLFCMEPFPTKKVMQVLSSAKMTMIAEGNSTGQARNLIRKKTGFLIPNVYLRYDGRPFEAVDIADKVKELLAKGSLPDAFSYPIPQKEMNKELKQ